MEENSQGNNEEKNQNGKGNNEIEGKGKIAREIKEAKKTVEEATKLVASLETGNVAQAVKSAAELAKSKAVKKRIKAGLRNILICVLIFVIIIGAVVSIFNGVVEKIKELLSSIGRELRTFWKWITDDYWIRLDDDIEYTSTDNTRSGSHKERYSSR